MSKIRFLGDKIIYSVEMSFTESRVILEPNEEIDKSKIINGFEELNEHNDFVQADFGLYRFIYREEENGRLTLTSDESDIYVEPTAPEPIPQPEPYKPTLNEVKSKKISSFSNICNRMIINGVTVDFDGTEEKFSYTESDQTNIKELFDTVLSTGLPVYYHADDKGDKPYTADQIIAIYIAQTINKTHHTKYFNQLKRYINGLDDIDVISSLEYGITELTGEFLNTYNSAMAQAKLNITTYLTKFGVNHETII